MVYVVGMQDGEHWRYHVWEDRSGIVALPTWTSVEGARSYIVKELEVLFVPLALDDEQVSIVAAMNGASVLLTDPTDGKTTGRVHRAPMPEDGSPMEKSA